MTDGTPEPDDIIRRRLFEVTGRTPPERSAASHGRRLGADLLGRVRDRVPGPVQAMGWGHVAALALVVSLVLLGGAWWMSRSRPSGELVPVSASRPVGSATGSLTEPATATAAPEPEVVVDVAGRVRHPGVYRLPEGSRVIDALEVAGGARPGVDLTQVNLARVLVDGEQILILRRARAGVPGAAAVPGGPGATVNLNTADQAGLESLPGVGPVTASSIIRWRQENGPFTSVDELVEVSGIGEVTLERLRPFVTV